MPRARATTNKAAAEKQAAKEQEAETLADLTDSLRQALPNPSDPPDAGISSGGRVRAVNPHTGTMDFVTPEQKVRWLIEEAAGRGVDVDDTVPDAVLDDARDADDTDD